MKETEFEKQQLEQLISDLKDIDKYTSFKNGAFIYDLGKYQGSLLVNEIERLNNIINELEKYINDNYFYDDVGMKIFDVSLLEDKIKELKESNNE